jgi:hypothetical protein
MCPAKPRVAIVTLGINDRNAEHLPTAAFQDFPGGISRLAADLRRDEFAGDFLYWSETYPPGCPPHRDVPYAFKPFCLSQARARNYDLVLWIDSSIRLRRSITPLFERLLATGYVFFRERHSIGDYCSDAALKTLGIDRENSFRLPSIRGSVVGLNLARPQCIAFLENWLRLAQDGITFHGPKWSGVRGWPVTASADPRVKGHRHDQTAASVVALQLSMDDWLSPRDFDSYFHNDRQAVRRLNEEFTKP